MIFMDSCRICNKCLCYVESGLLQLLHYSVSVIALSQFMRVAAELRRVP